MRQIIGNRRVELSPAAFAQLRERHQGMLLDVGTGDGKHVLDAARH